MVNRATVDLNWSGATGSPGANVFHFRTVIDADIPEFTSALQAFYQAIAAAFPQTWQASFDGRVFQGIEGDAPTIADAPSWTVGGTAGGGGYAPPALAIVVGWRTSLATRSGRGRTFLGPLHNSTMGVDGTPQAATLGVVAAAATALLNESQAGLGAFGVWSPTDNVLRDWTGATVRDIFAILRSRRD